MGVADGRLNKGHSLPHLPSGEAGSLGTLLGMRAWLHLSSELTPTQMQEWRPREVDCLEPTGTASPDSSGCTPEP